MEVQTRKITRDYREEGGIIAEKNGLIGTNLQKNRSNAFGVTVLSIMTMDSALYMSLDKQLQRISF